MAERIEGRVPAVRGGDAMPKSNFTLRLDDETRAWVEQEAREQQRSVANFILYVLRQYRDAQDASRSLSTQPTSPAG